MDNGVCKEPTEFYLLAVALRSFFLVLATHLLAGEVDTSLGAEVSLPRRISWWCRYFNPLNLSWRYYSMFAYRFTAHSWGPLQLALINHEEHPLLPPLPYIVGETVRPLHVRRLEMAGLLSSQGILTFSAAYQGVLAIQYAISTEGIPYLPNTTVPLAMVGIFRVMACKWVASKIHVDAYPYPSMPTSPRSNSTSRHISHPLSNANAFLLHVLHLCKSKLCSSSLTPTTDTKLADSPSTPPLLTMPSSICRLAPHPPSPQTPSTSVLLSHNCPLLPIISRPYSMLHFSQHPIMTSVPSANVSTSHSPAVLPSQSMHSCIPSLSEGSLFPPLGSAPHAEHHTSSFINSSQLSSSSSFSSTVCLKLESPSMCSQYAAGSPPLLSDEPSNGFEMHTCLQTEQPLPYKSNPSVVCLWVGVLIALVTMSFLPYKVAAAYQLPHRLLQFSMQVFYQYIAVSELFFHGYLLYQGPRALANRVLFFDHWAFKAQTVGFFCLLIFMLVIALLDFVKHEFYRTCA